MASGALGRLNVLLGLDSTEFTAGLSKADYQSKQTLDKIAKTAVIAGAAIATAFTAAGAAMAAQVKQSIDAMDSMSKLAQKTGTTVEALSSLSYAAGLSDVSADELGSALTKLTKNMSDTEKGTGEAREGFKALGINVKDANGHLKSSDTVLSEVAAKFATYKDGAEKTALAINLFGKSGADLIPLLNSGKDGIVAMQAESSRLGVTLSTETAKAAEDFNDSLTRLHTVQQGWVDSVTAEVLPALNKFAEFAVAVASSTDDVQGSVTSLANFIGLHDWLDSVGMKIAQTIDELVLLGKAVIVVVQSFEGMFANIATFLASTTQDNTGIAEYFNPDAVKRNNEQLAAEFAKRNKTIADGQKALDDLLRGNKTTYQDLWIAGRTPDSKGAGVQTLAPVLVKSPKDAKQKVDKDPLGTFIKGEDIQHQLDEYQKYLDFRDKATGQALAKQRDKEQQWLAGMLDVGEITKEQYTKTLEELQGFHRDTFDEMGEFAKEAARNIQNALGDNLYSLLKGNFDNIGAAFSDMLLKMAADLAASQLSSALFGNFDKTGAIGGLLGSAISGFKMGLGGPVSDGGVVLGDTLRPMFGTGGYTGPGGKYEPAGIVHKGEYVLNQDATRRVGVGMLDRINKGYANGGLVGGGSMAGLDGGVTVNVIGGPQQQPEVQTSRDQNGGLNIDLIYSQMENRLAGGVQSGQGKLGNSIQKRFGLVPQLG